MEFRGAEADAVVAHDGSGGYTRTKRHEEPIVHNNVRSFLMAGGHGPPTSDFLKDIYLC
jgi:hypothetical protein